MDIETSPLISYTWGIWEQNVIEVKKEWYIMCFSAKWKNGEHITKGLIDYPGTNDKALVKEIWHVLNEAEIVVWQNGDKFDGKKLNARFAFWNMPPPSPYRAVDTLKIARRHFAFTSNKLDDLGQYLGLGRKIKHEGFDLWKKCMANDKKAWNQMKLYNRQDVVLLEKVYLHLLPWIKNHPNLTVYSQQSTCPKCGNNNLVRRGYQYNNTTKYARIYCKSCHGWARSPVNVQETKPLLSI